MPGTSDDRQPNRAVSVHTTWQDARLLSARSIMRHTWSDPEERRHE